MKRTLFNRKNLLRICFSLLVIVIAALLIVGYQNNVSRKNQYAESYSTLSDISASVDVNQTARARLLQTYHNGNLQILDDLCALTQSQSIDWIFQDTQDSSFEVLKSIGGNKFARYLFLTDSKCNIILARDKDEIGKNLCALGFFSDTDLQNLLSCPEEGVLSCPDGKESFYFYAAPLNYRGESAFLTMGVSADAFENQMESLSDIGHVIDFVDLPDGRIIFTVDPQTNIIVYCTDDSLGLTGCSCSDAGIPAALLTDGASDTIKINGTEYYCVAVQMSGGEILVEIVSTSSRFSNNYKPTFWAIVLLVLVLATALTYALNLPKDLFRRKMDQKAVHLFGSGLVLNKEQVLHMIPFLIWGAVLIFGCVFYCRTILKLSWAMSDVDRPLGKLDSELTEVAQEKEQFLSYSNQLYTFKLQMIADMIETNPSCLNEETEEVHTVYTESGEKEQITDDEGNPLHSVPNSEYLENLCQNNDFEAIQIFNDQGYTIASSNNAWYFVLSLDSEEQSYAFRDVLDGRQDSLVQGGQTDDDGNFNQYVGVSCHYYTTVDEDGNTLYVSAHDYQNQLDGIWDGNPISRHRGLVQCIVDATAANDLMQTTDIAYILKNISQSNNAYTMAFDSSEEHRTVYTPNAQNLGKTAAELNITENEFSGSFNGFQTINGVRYFVCCRYSNGYYIALATPFSSLFSTRLPITAFCTVVCLAAMLLVMGAFLITTEKEMLERQLPGECAAPLNRKADIWNDKTAEEKSQYVLQICLFLIGLYFLLGLLTQSLIFADSAVMKYVFSDKWERGFNIFALTKSVVVLVAVIVAVNMISMLVNVTSSVVLQRVATVSSLLMSFLQYLAVVAAFFYCLYLFGFQASSLLASAGILTAVIGLGSKALIQDMMAGLFLVFEGSIHVGDIITIGSTSGIVQEISVRTTILRDLNNSIVVINNSDIKDVLNSSIKVAKIRMNLRLSGGVTLEQAEEILSSMLPQLKEKIPELMGIPVYESVAQVGSGSFTLRVNALCSGANRPKTTRKLNREILVAFAAHNIAVDITVE